MAISRDDLKAKRLKAMAVVGSQMDASAAMFDRLIAAGQKVTDARTAAETAHMAAIDAQVADLNEMAQEFTDMGNAAAPASTVTAAPAPAGIGAPLPTALDALMRAQPNPVKTAGPIAGTAGAQPSSLASEAMLKGDAYVGTHGEIKP